jgi:hypothetical protein
MELSGYISITIKGKTENGSLNPKDIDIAETKELLTDVEILLYPTKPEKDERPKVSYEVKEGSVNNIFHILAAKAIMFNALMAEIGTRGNLDLLDSKAASIIDKWQRRAYDSNRQYSISSSVSPTKPVLTISKGTQFIAPKSNWVNTSLYLYGRIYEEGGLNRVNLHILTDRYGKLPVKATEEQLTTGENKLFKIYGVWAKGKQNVDSGELKDLELIEFITYQPEYDDLVLQKSIQKASANWKSIKDKDAWLTNIRGGVNE